MRGFSCGFCVACPVHNSVILRALHLGFGVKGKSLY